MKFEIEIPGLLENLSGIYKIENNIDNRVYIGRAKNLRNRAEQHKRKYRIGDCNRKVKCFLKEHPEAAFKFTVLVFTDSIKEAEEKAIAEYRAVEDGFNMIHNDEEFLARKWDWHRKPKERKKVDRKREKAKRILDDMGTVSKLELERLERGYIVGEGKLKYAPYIAKALLAEIGNRKVFEESKHKMGRRDKEWKPADLSFLFKAKLNG